MFKRKPPFWLGLLYGCVVIIAIYAAFNAFAIHRYMSGIQETPLNQWQGNEDGKKVIVEFVDFRCSYCRNIHPVVQDLIEKHPEIKVVYRHYPVFGEQSLHEAQIALAAGMQGKYSEAHNLLMAREKPVIQAEIDVIARHMDLDIDKFMTDLKGPEIGNYLLYNIKASQILNINSTPTFIIGDVVFRPLTENPTVKMFEKILEQEYGS